MKSKKKSHTRPTPVPTAIPSKLPRRYGCSVCGKVFSPVFPGQICEGCFGINTVRRLRPWEVAKVKVIGGKS